MSMGETTEKWDIHDGKAPLEIITELAAVLCSFITEFYMSQSMCAA